MEQMRAGGKVEELLPTDGVKISGNPLSSVSLIRETLVEIDNPPIDSVTIHLLGTG